MESTDKVTGNKIVSLLDQTRKDRTILRMNVLGTGYEGLTMVIGFDNKNGKQLFIIDYPSSSDVVLSQDIEHAGTSDPHDRRHHGDAQCN